MLEAALAAAVSIEDNRQTIAVSMQNAPGGRTQSAPLVLFVGPTLHATCPCVQGTPACVPIRWIHFWIERARNAPLDLVMDVMALFVA
jgi:hypothetical protein